MGLGMGMELPPVSTRAMRSSTPRGAEVAPQTPLETPTVDLQQVMNWILSVTPRAGAEGTQVGAPGSLVSPIMTGGGAGNGGVAGRGGLGGSGGGAVEGATAVEARVPAVGVARGPISLESAGGSGQHSALLQRLFSGTPMGSPGHGHGGVRTGASAARRSPRLSITGGPTPTGLDLANGIASGVTNMGMGAGIGVASAVAGSGPGGQPASPNFTPSELNLLLSALGGTGDTPTSVVSGAINPFFGRADASAHASALRPATNKAPKK